MTNYMRMRYGLRWKRKYPPIPWVWLVVVIHLLAAYMLTQYVIELIDRAGEMEMQASSNSGLAKVVLDCMNGSTGFYFPRTGLAFTCGQQL